MSSSKLILKANDLGFVIFPISWRGIEYAVPQDSFYKPHHGHGKWNHKHFRLQCIHISFTKELSQTTWEHSEDGSEGIELKSINDVAGVDQLQTHQAEAHHQQNDVQHLRNQWQPQHPWKTGTCDYNNIKSNRSIVGNSFVVQHSFCFTPSYLNYLLDLVLQLYNHPSLKIKCRWIWCM